MEDEPTQETELGAEIAGVLEKYGDEYGFDVETVAEIAVMPFEEAFEAAYGYLAQAGLDPDEILAEFMEEPADGDF